MKIFSCGGLAGLAGGAGGYRGQQRGRKRSKKYGVQNRRAKKAPSNGYAEVSTAGEWGTG